MGISALCVIKADIMKAFISVHWEFVLNILCAIGILDCFVRWVEVCIIGAVYSININDGMGGYI